MSVYAPDYGYFSNSNNRDRKYNAESFEEWLKPFFNTGIFNGGLQVTAQSTPDMTVKVSAGYANINGKAAPRRVKIGLSDGVNVQILKGLSVGDSVVTSQETKSAKSSRKSDAASPFMPQRPGKKKK